MDPALPRLRLRSAAFSACNASFSAAADALRSLSSSALSSSFALVVKVSEMPMNTSNIIIILVNQERSIMVGENYNVI
jgi:hypothetical protein